MATDYPNAKITGVDIVPIQPSGIKPSNVDFVDANILNGLPFEDDTFDYVFQRLMFGSIPRDHWANVVGELTRVLKPGGYLELSEIGPPYDLGPVSTKLFRAADDMLTSRNLDYKILYSLRFFVEQNGQFENIVEEKEIMYFGATTGKLGRATVDNVKIGFISMRHYVLPFLGGTPEEYDEMVDAMGKEMSCSESYQHIIRVYARKREED